MHYGLIMPYYIWKKELLYLSEYIKSPLNYVGGKHKLLSQLLPLFPTDIKHFVDLFGGGFNVGINVEAEKVTYNDMCKQVSSLLQYIQEKPVETLLAEIDGYIKQYALTKENQAGYLLLRNDYNLNSATVSPMMFYTLICYAFNNQIRFNNAEKFNVPFGTNRSFNIALREKFISFVNKLKMRGRYVFKAQDFTTYANIEYEEGLFVYCDPPYANTSAVYNTYWNVQSEDKLLSQLDIYTTRGIKWALSNNITTNPKLKIWAKNKGYAVHELQTSYANCNYQKKNKAEQAQEVLITNY